jgi:hypothetical protein
MASLLSSQNIVWLGRRTSMASRATGQPPGRSAQFRRRLLPALLALLALLPACRTTLPPADLSAPGWRVRHGQAIWKPSANEAEIAGELLLAVNADGYALAQFSKSPFTLVDARFTPGGWRIEFPLRRDRASGEGDLPARIVWFQLPAAGFGRTPGADWRFTGGSGGWRWENLRTGETLEGYWTP